ncbi:MAG: RelA/SpoT domain-containing protein [Deferribacteraceae bacterium]|jgi:ppGpp synthetase/RelA/SpoT-type nucleotidyltranferase|nr:RelA/SpoT domain-containing protein [Deferribacteraceae bacterium]
MSDTQIDIPSKSAVRKAGDILKSSNPEPAAYDAAAGVLSQWRSLHSYPINTFQAYLRNRIKRDGYRSAIIAQRLKRMPSIITKLQRFSNMQLDRMQDIGGLRVVVDKISDVYRLYESILSSRRFAHRPELPPKDYIKSPKSDGYRSLHQVFKYANKSHPELSGLRIELQIRTKLQHSWATAVETLGMIEKSSFKTGEGDEKFKTFFKLSSALFALQEETPVIDEYASEPSEELVMLLNLLESELQVCSKLESLALSAKHIETASKRTDGYHLMELNVEKDTISLIAFSKNQLQDAENLYRIKEIASKDDPNISVVLISAGNVANIKKAYPNYFLDTASFIKSLNAIRL